MRDKKRSDLIKFLGAAGVFLLWRGGRLLWYLCLAGAVIWPTLAMARQTGQPNWPLLVTLFLIGLALNLTGKILGFRMLKNEERRHQEVATESQ